MSRTFRVPDGRTVTLPQGLYAGPGATNMRLDPGAVVTLEDDKLQEYQRFIGGRLRAGDFEEIDMGDAHGAPGGRAVPSANMRTGGIHGMTAPMLPKKEN